MQSHQPLLADFLDKLVECCGDHVISDAPRLSVYESDGLTARHALPGVVVLPDTIAEVQAVVRLCHEYQVPLVARGAGTGLSGGATPHSEGVLLGLAKFNKVISVDPVNRTACVEPGVTNLAISDAVRDLGLYYAPDPSSQVACTIGGNVAENSGGVHCLKYGLTVHNVRKLKVVSPEGDLYEVGSDALDSAGYDLLSVMHGSEGLLGIVMEVTVNLLPSPDKVCVVMAGFDTIAGAGDAVGAVIAGGILPAGLEMMDKPAIAAAEAFVSAGYPLDVEALLLCELDGTGAEVAAQLVRLREIFSAHGARSVEVAFEEADRAKLWQGRKAAFPAVGRISPDYYCMDGTIPRRELAGVLTEITNLSQRYALGVANVFHAGDGNLHPLILYDANRPGELERAEAFGAAILELCIKKGGTITGEHGVGIEKIDQMCVQFTADELRIFHGVKASFDASGILNPGKGVPTLHRCAEFGAMHVHRGEEKFPHLDRF
jgi:glycolate oxidase